MSHGNYVAASAAYFAFNWDIHGSNLAVLPINTKGRQIKASVPLIYAHADFVTDFAFICELAGKIKEISNAPLMVGNAQPSIAPEDFLRILRYSAASF